MRLRLSALIGCTAILVTGCAGSHDTATNGAPNRTIALVLNTRSDFWKPAEAGVEKAQEELPDFNLVVRYPKESTAASQISLVEELVAEGVSGIMISTIDPRAERDQLDQVGKKVPLVATDSDLPGTSRIAFIGSSNEQSGELAGKIVLEALPNGGKCVGFVGRQSALNSRERIAGLNQTIHAANITLVEVMDDNGDQDRVQQNAVAALREHPDANCMIGFYWYDAPSIYDALKKTGRVGNVKVIAFDDHEATLRGIANGGIAGTVAQQPYAWGYQGMKDLARYVNGDKSWVPENQTVFLPSLIVDQGNLRVFRDQQARY
jgi:ribose transport system substrate-binding protein